MHDEDGTQFGTFEKCVDSRTRAKANTSPKGKKKESNIPCVKMTLELRVLPHVKSS